jgi:hypothetical protein
MTPNECKTFRRELEEADPNHQMSTKARDHLSGCAECRSFDSDQRALRGLIASLEPVAAPSDFDFRLRARLAREKSGAGNGAGVSSFLRFLRPVAAVALVLLIAVAGVVFKNWMTPSTTTVVNVPPRSEVVSPEPGGGTKAVVSSSKTQAGVTGVVATSGGSENNPGTRDRYSPTGSRNNVPRNPAVVLRKGEASATRELGLSPAPVLGSEETDNAGAVVRVPLNARALQISIDDGRGATRTISLPTVSFGSQRLMASQSFLPTRASVKGVW